MNYVDLIIVILFIAYISAEYSRGFLRLASELLGLILAFALGLKYYLPLSIWLMKNFRQPDFLSIVKPLSFLIIWFVAQLVIYLLGRVVSFYTPRMIKESKVNLYLGFLPATAKAYLFIAVILILFVVTPFDNRIKNAVKNSYLGNRIANSTLKFEAKLEGAFSNNPTSTLSFMSESANPDEVTYLNFATNQMKIDPAAEAKLLELVNNARLEEGLVPLKEDILIRNVARMHSRDMIQRGYFSHDSLAGQNLFTRLSGANAIFRSAAENIALSPTPELAHLGLMNSPKHRENIMDPDFTKIGIGIVDVSPYGLMITEDFAN